MRYDCDHSPEPTLRPWRTALGGVRTGGQGPVLRLVSL